MHDNTVADIRPNTIASMPTCVKYATKRPYAGGNRLNIAISIKRLWIWGLSLTRNAAITNPPNRRRLMPSKATYSRENNLRLASGCCRAVGQGERFGCGRIQNHDMAL